MTPEVPPGVGLSSRVTGGFHSSLAMTDAKLTFVECVRTPEIQKSFQNQESCLLNYDHQDLGNPPHQKKNWLHNYKI